MKKRVIVFILLAILLFVISASAEKGKDPGRIVYDKLVSEERAELEDALNRFADVESKDQTVLSFVQKLRDVQTCTGRFYQLDDQGALSSKYYADISIYLQSGKLWAHVEYTNYSGTLSDAAIDYDDSGKYLFVTHPTGTFYSNSHVFDISITEEKMHVRWAEDIEYDLTRGDGSVEAAEEKETPFTETEAYASAVETITKLFNGYDCDFAFDEENHELFVYVAFKNNFHTKLVNFADSMRADWKNVLDTLCDVTEKMATVIDLGTRKEIIGLHYGHCTITIVDILQLSNQYSTNQTSAIVRDGSVVHSAISLESTGTASSSASSGSSSSSSATAGERNALESAKAYLNVMAFSRKGLIGQLEYEGYSTAEATYAVNHCGANWNEQAAKSAAAYLAIMSFSRSELIEQLEYEGFTSSEASYGVSAAYR